MIKILAFIIFLSTALGDISFNWNQNTVNVKILGELTSGDQLLENYHFVGDTDLMELRKLNYNFPSDTGYVSN